VLGKGGGDSNDLHYYLQMKIAFISDLHSCLTALETVLADCKVRGVDRIVCLGDVIDMGPQPVEVVDLLREQGIPTVRGNHDTLDENPSLPFLRDLEDWTRSKLRADQLEWLAALPLSQVEEVEHLRLLMVHGSPESNTQGLVAETPMEDINRWLSESQASVMLAGHTHVPLVRYVREGVAINVGSTAVPFAEANVIPPIGLPYSEYVVLEIESGNTVIQQIRLPLDLDAFRKAMAKTDMPHQDNFMSVYAQ
tara:strand:- start:86 stop:841 length:756 start_codon:yes stop_codon:yes gene_type:complete